MKNLWFWTIKFALFSISDIIYLQFYIITIIKMNNLEIQESMAELSEDLIDLENLKSEIIYAEQPEMAYENANRNQPEKKTYKWVVLDPEKKYNVCEDPFTKEMGSKTFEWHIETYYSANPRTRPHFDIHKTARPVPGVHIAKSDGTVRDKDGYIVLACNDLKFGDVVMTSLWPGKVYDRWWMRRKNHIDIFTNR